MITPYKKIIVYDLETGGFDSDINSITEIAMVAIDTEKLEIIDEMSVMISPYVDLNFTKDGRIEVKRIFKNLSEIVDGKKVLKFKNKNLGVIESKELEVEFENFNEDLDSKKLLSFDDIITLLTKESSSDVMKMYLNQTYNKQALSVTNMSLSTLEKDGKKMSEAFNEVELFIKKQVDGNNKPLIAGHNIVKFDNPFFAKFFEQNGKKMFGYFSDKLIIDTLELARLKWFESASFNLGTCCNNLDITLKSAHRALPDTIANAKFLISMLKSLRGEGVQKENYTREKFNFNL